MASLRTYALCILTSLALVAPANGAQEGGVPPVPGGEGEITVPEDLNRGEEVTISYSNPALAGTAVTIDIDDGFQGGQTDTVQIELDAAGNGSMPWTVPNWMIFAKFNAPDAEEKVSRLQ